MVGYTSLTILRPHGINSSVKDFRERTWAPPRILQTRPPCLRLKTLSTWMSSFDWSKAESLLGALVTDVLSLRDRLATASFRETFLKSKRHVVWVSGRLFFKPKRHVMYIIPYLKTWCTTVEGYKNTLTCLFHLPFPFSVCARVINLYRCKSEIANFIRIKWRSSHCDVLG